MTLFINFHSHNEPGLEGVPSFNELLKFIPLIGIPVNFVNRDWVGVVCMFLELILVFLGINRVLKMVICLILFVVAGFSAAANFEENGASGLSLAVSAAGAIFCFVILVA